MRRSVRRNARRPRALRTSGCALGSEAAGLALLPTLLSGFADTLDAFGKIEPTGLTEIEVTYLHPQAGELGRSSFKPAPAMEALKAVQSGDVEFAILPRPISDAEAARLVGLGLKDPRGPENETQIALDALSVVVHPSNPVKSLSYAQLQGVFSGEITNWSQLGGPAGAITVVVPTARANANAVMQTTQLGELLRNGSAPLEVKTTEFETIARLVQRTPSAIGFARLKDRDGLQHVAVSGSCGIPYDVSRFGAVSGDYPFAEGIYLYSQDAHDFVDYATTGAAAELIDATVFMSLGVTRQPQPAERLASLYNGLTTEEERELAASLERDLQGFDRLSTTIRFQPGASDLTSRDRTQLRRVAAYIAKLPADAEILVAGFADSSGPFEPNARTSELRAQTVATELEALQAAGVFPQRIKTRGFGELAPVACNSDITGRAINRRVEIWVSTSKL